MKTRIIILFVAAVAAALLPLPPGLVERWYSRGLYPVLQNVVTRVSRAIPIALLDPALVVLVVAWVVLIVRRWRREGGKAGLRAAAMSLLVAVSVLYLAFLLLWGLNYRRLPLESKLVYEPSRITQAETLRLAEAAVERVNALEPRKGTGPTGADDTLEASFVRSQGYLGASRSAIPAPAKRSLLRWYLRQAGIDGMMNPFFLEIILNPDVLPVEYPFTLAHEWAHLAGYADESEANFLAWLTCVGGDPGSQYSGWLEAYRYAAAALPRDARRSLQQRLAPGVLADLRAINARLGRADPVVSGFARQVYDSYLRAQGIDEGIANYGAMLRLMLGTTFENGWVPRLR